MQKTAAPTSTSDSEILYVAGDPNLSAEQRARYAILREHLSAQEAEWARMTPEERERADAEWELVKRQLNEDRKRAGSRLLFPDEDE